MTAPLFERLYKWQRARARGAADSVDTDGGTSVCSRGRGPAQDLRQDLIFRRLTERVWRLGPRPSAELLFELIAHDDIEADVVARLESYAELEPLVRVIPEARTWPPAPITVVP